jgi:Meiotically up-regulated gene 113
VVNRIVRQRILEEIRRLAIASAGQPPGADTFERESGIRQSSWRGVYWARWGDALTEAGYQPNLPPAKIEKDDFLRKIAEVCRHFGKAPTAMEFRLYGRSHPEIPNHKTIYRHFHSTANMFRRLAEWASENGGYADVAAMLTNSVVKTEKNAGHTVDGFVYLIRWGKHFKIGRGEELERRVKQVRTGLPDSGSLVHVIRTDDPSGIEAYWHRRFADKRAENGEWFKLASSDIAAFKRRKFQ